MPAQFLKVHIAKSCRFFGFNSVKATTCEGKGREAHTQKAATVLGWSVWWRILFLPLHCVFPLVSFYYFNIKCKNNNIWIVFQKISDGQPGSDFQDTARETQLPGGIGPGLWYISRASVRKLEGHIPRSVEIQVISLPTARSVILHPSDEFALLPFMVSIRMSHFWWLVFQKMEGNLVTPLARWLPKPLLAKGPRVQCVRHTISFVWASASSPRAGCWRGSNQVP